MNLNDLFNEEKVRLDPKCWTGKKIGNPKTKVKGGVRVNNCVPAESVEEGKEDKVKQLKQDYATAVHWSKNDTNPHKREAARQKAEKIKRHLETQYKQGVAEGSEEYCDACDRVITKKPHVCPGSQGVAEEQELDEKWSEKYKSSINCANPKGFSQRAHCAGRNKNEDVAEAKPPGSRRDPFDLPPLEGPGAGGGHQVPQFTVPIIPPNVPGGANMPMAGRNLARDMATGRNVGGEAIPSLGQPGKVVTNKTADNVLTKLGGKNVDISSAPTVKSGSSNVNVPLDVEVPTYIRQGKPDPVTVPKIGTKPKITVRPGETLSQAIERTKAEQEFSNFLKGQGGQSFGTAGGGRGGQGGPTAAQATSDSGQVPTIRLPSGKLSVDPSRLSPSGQYNTQSGSRKSIDQIEYDDMIAVDAMVKRARQSAIDREAKSKKQSDRIEPVQPKWKNRDTDQDLEEARKKREQPEVDYDDEYDAMVARVKKLAGLGPMKTVYDPAKRQYRNMPAAQQPKVQPKK